MGSVKKQEFKEGVSNKRVSHKNNLLEQVKNSSEEYTVYGLFYVDPWLGKNTNATAAAENSEESISLLEKSLNEKGQRITKNDLNAVAEDTGYKTFKKGMIYGYDSFSRSMLH